MRSGIVQVPTHTTVIHKAAVDTIYLPAIYYAESGMFYRDRDGGPVVLCPFFLFNLTPSKLYLDI